MVYFVKKKGVNHMKRRNIFSILFVALSFCFFISGCSQKAEDYNFNLSIINNTGESFKSITLHTESESQNIIDAKNSVIKSGEKVNLKAPYSQFKLQVVTDGDSEYISQDFVFDFEENNEPQKISIEKDSTDNVVFIVVE